MKYIDTSIVQHIVNLAIEIEQNRPSEEVFDAKSIEVLNQSNEQIALINYLNSLSQNQLAEVCAVMWVGRDFENVPSNKIDFAEVVNEAQQMHNLSSYISGKTPLARYLSNGISKIKS